MSFTTETDFDLEGERVVGAEWITGGRARFSIRNRPRGDDRRVIVTDLDGVPVAELRNANPGPVTWTLNEPEEWAFALAVDDERAATILPPHRFREVQLWRGDQLLSWGPIVNRKIDGPVVDVSGRGALWHLLRRYIGSTADANLLSNGDFEEGLAGWTAFKTSGFLDLTGNLSPSSVAVGTTRAFSGRKSLSITHHSSESDFSTPFVFQEVEVTAGDFPVEVVFVARVYVPSSVTDQGNGLRLTVLPEDYRDELYPGSGTALGYRNMYWTSEETTTSRIGPDHPRDQWVRHEVRLVVPPNTTKTVHARFEPPKGTTYFDRAGLFVDEALEFSEVDQATIVGDLIEHLQDPAYGKADVNLEARTAPTGVLRSRRYAFADHPAAREALAEFTVLADGLDFRLDYTPTARIVTTRYPAEGTYRRDLTLETGRNVGAFAWGDEGEGASNSIIVLGNEGSGPGREESVAIDPDAFSGTTLEEVFQAPADSDVLALDELALERLEVASNPETLAVKLYRAPTADLIGVLRVGDWVDVAIEWGAFRVEDVYRVVRMTLTPEDQLEAVLNRREVIE